MVTEIIISFRSKFVFNLEKTEQHEMMYLILAI